jgi:creatinine amidohydrolase
VAALDRSAILAVPVGSTEQHGPHLPLSTDSLVATALVEGLAASRHDVIAAPLVPVGASGEHDGFAGTLSVGTEVLASYCVELVRSSRGWARGVVFVSGHGGNAEAMARVGATCAYEGDRVVTFLPSVPGGDAHAGRTETSLVLALGGHLVRHNEAVPGTTTPLRELDEALRSRGVRAVSPNGVLGDPTGATRGEGRRICDLLAGDLRRAVSDAFGDPA